MSSLTHVLTLMAPRPSLGDISLLTTLLSEQGIALLEQRDVPVPRALADRRRVVALSIHVPEPQETLEHALREVARSLDLDIVLQDVASRQADYRLAVFDMDSTLIQCEVIDELATRAGVGEAVAAITARAMRGELDFNGSFTERLSMLEGLSENVLDDIASALPITEGLPELMVTLRAQGIKTAILSGGFHYFAERLQQTFGFDVIYANTLAIEGGCVTGEVVPPIVNGDIKAALLQKLAAEYGLSTEQVIAVGDGANDLPMLGLAGLGVALHAKPLVQAKARYVINTVGIDGVMYLLGPKSEC